MGREGCGTMNDNRERLLDICTTYDFVIGGTLFPHQDVHKLTWYSPKGRDKKQIYHLMINGIWRRPLLGVRVRRGADVGSDHHLVTTTLKLKLRKTESSPRGQQHFHVEKLRDLEAETTFTPQLKDKFQVLADAEDQTQEGSGDINAKWQQLKIAYEQTCKACLGTKQRKRKEWITEDTWQAIENRRTLKKKVLEAKSEQLKERYKQQHSEANPAAKRMTRTDKRSYISDLPSKPGRRCSKQGRARQSLQDHQAGVWQVQKRHWRSNHGQAGATNHDRSRTRRKRDGTLQWSSEQTTTTTTTTTNRGRYTRGRDRPGCQHRSPRKRRDHSTHQVLQERKIP